MTKPSFSSTTLPYFNSAANTVESEQFHADAKLFYISLPFVDPDTSTGLIPHSENITWFPKRKIIVLAGLFTGDEANILLFINEIEGQILSSLQNSRVYTNSVGKTYQVKLNTFSYTLSNESNTICRWNIELYNESGV